MRKMSASCEFGRLEVVLDRSWETRPVTWSNLTWWDPIPCGGDLMSSLRSSEPLPLPSPALSVLGQPPTPRRRLPPTQLNFRSSSVSPSPIPTRTISPLAWPLPPSPCQHSQSYNSYNSVFLHSDSSTPPYQVPVTPSSLSSLYCSSPMYPETKPMFPTPPDCGSSHQLEVKREKFSFRTVPVIAGSVVMTPPEHLPVANSSYY